VGPQPLHKLVVDGGRRPRLGGPWTTDEPI